MKRAKEEEKWIHRMKELMEEHTEPLPPGGWERLESELPAVPAAHGRKRVAWLRWSVAAAAVLLVAVSGIVWRLMQSPAVEEVLQAEVPQVPADLLPELPEPLLPARVQAEAPRPLAAATRREPKRETVVFVDADTLQPECEVFFPPQPEQEQPATDEKQEAAPREPKKTTIETTDPLPPTSEKRHSARGRWAVAFSVGNTGGMNGGGGADEKVAAAEPPRPNHSDAGDKDDDDEATTRGGTLGGKRIMGASHKQPLTFGLSVRRNLKHGFSIETGLAYTYLASDVNYVENDFFHSGRQLLHYLGIPLRANWNFYDRGRFTAYLSAGGTVEKCIYGTVDGSRYVPKELQFSLNAAVGAQYNLSRRVGVYVEPGFSYFFDDGSPAMTIRKENPRNFTLQGGIRLTY